LIHEKAGSREDKMKKLVLVVLALLIMVSAFADWKDDLKKEGIDPRLFLHGIGGFIGHAVIFTGAANVTFMQEHTEEWSFYITSTIIVGEELHSNNWEGVKFWKLTSAFLGMRGSMLLLDGKRPIIYANYDVETKAIELEFAFNWDFKEAKK